MLPLLGFVKFQNCIAFNHECTRTTAAGYTGYKQTEYCVVYNNYR